MRTQVPLAAFTTWSRRPGRHPGRACHEAALVAAVRDADERGEPVFVLGGSKW